MPRPPWPKQGKASNKLRPRPTPLQSADDATQKNANAAKKLAEAETQKKAGRGAGQRQNQ